MAIRWFNNTPEEKEANILFVKSIMKNGYSLTNKEKKEIELFMHSNADNDSWNWIKGDKEYRKLMLEYMKWHEKTTETQEEELAVWEKEILSLYKINFIPYGEKVELDGGCDGFSYGNLDSQILIKAVQNDIRLFLNKVDKGFSGEIKINYKNGRPEFMTANFETIEGNSKHDELKKFVGDFGFVAYKRYGHIKKTYGEKLYRYTDKNWQIDKTCIPKKAMSGKSKQKDYID